jgi:hypothetical protein
MANTSSVFTPTFIRAEFTGVNGTGPISVPGLEAGDIILAVAQGGPGMLAYFENSSATITVSNEIQQTLPGDLSTVVLTCYLMRD